MEFFTGEIANTLQYFTFPLEAIGLTLASIEVRFPGMARRICAQIADAAARISQDEEETTQYIRNTGTNTSPMTRFQARLLGYAMPVAVILVLILCSLIGYVTLTYGFNSSSPEAHEIKQKIVVFGRWIVAPFYFGMMLVLIVHVVSSSVVKFADSFVEGRAVGTLGIIIAGFGMLGEAYQFTTQLIT